MKRRKLQELNLLDDFLFETMVGHKRFGKRFVRILLETIFQRKFGRLSVVPQKDFPGRDADLHGARLDVYLEEKTEPVVPAGTAAGAGALEEGEEKPDRGLICDIEPENQRREAGSLPERSRFYHAIMTTHNLKAGKKYAAMKNEAVIFITPYDPYGLGRMVYTMRSVCEEEPGMAYDDGTRTLYLYTRGTRGECPEKLRQLLRYMETTTEEHAVNETLKELHRMVEIVKSEKEAMRSYMKSFEREELIREEERVNTERERKRADREREKAKQEREKAEQERERADALEEEIRKLKQELQKYQGIA